MNPRRRFAVLAALCGLALAPVASAHAALVYDKGLTTGKPSVWIAADDGSSPRRLGSGDLPHISPDGTTVVFEEIGSKANGFKPRLMKVPAAGGIPTVLLKPFWISDGFAFSPDSTTIATITGREIGTRRLVLVNVATGVARTVASGYFFGVSFSPDGTQIAYSHQVHQRYLPFSAADVFTAAVAGGTPSRITRGGKSTYPVWGPKTIVLARQRRAHRKDDAPKQDLYTVKPDGTKLHRLTRTNVPFLLSGLSPIEWSADGTRLLAEFGGQDTSYAETVNPATGRVRHVGRYKDGIVGYGLSRTGGAVLAVTGGPEPGGAHQAVVTFPYSGGAMTVLVKHASDPDWTR